MNRELLLAIYRDPLYKLDGCTDPEEFRLRRKLAQFNTQRLAQIAEAHDQVLVLPRLTANMTEDEYAQLRRQAWAETTRNTIDRYEDDHLVLPRLRDARGHEQHRELLWQANNPQTSAMVGEQWWQRCILPEARTLTTFDQYETLSSAMDVFVLSSRDRRRVTLARFHDLRLILPQLWRASSKVEFDTLRGQAESEWGQKAGRALA